MAAPFFRKRTYNFLFNLFISKSKTHRQQILKYFIRQQFYSKSIGPVLYKINLAKFYNGTNPLYNVNTYENLVKQKSNGSGEKKCRESKEHPGRHRFHKDIEAALNDQIEMELNASLAYLSMASYFGRTEVALPGCQGFFMMMHEEEHEHAIVFLNYVLMRGGHVNVPCVASPENQDWGDIAKTFRSAVQLECQVKEKLEELVGLSDKHNDHHLSDFIAGEFLDEQNRSINTLGRLLTRSKMADDDVGTYLFDQHLFESFVKHHKNNLMYTRHLPEEETQKVYK